VARATFTRVQTSAKIDSRPILHFFFDSSLRRTIDVGPWYAVWENRQRDLGRAYRSFSRNAASHKLIFLAFVARD
jgi:hypothetical protein